MTSAHISSIINSSELQQYTINSRHGLSASESLMRYFHLSLSIPALVATRAPLILCLWVSLRLRWFYAWFHFLIFFSSIGNEAFVEHVIRGRYNDIRMVSRQVVIIADKYNSEVAISSFWSGELCGESHSLIP